MSVSNRRDNGILDPRFWGVLLLAAVLLALPSQWQGARRINVGAPDAEPALSGFYFPEEAGGLRFRWSGAEGTVRFTDVANRPLIVRLYLHALRPAEPALVTVSANGRELATFAVGGVFAEKDLALPRSIVGWNGDLAVSVRSLPFNAPPDTRRLGAAVAWIELAPTAGPAVPPLPVFLPLLLACAGLAVFAPRFHPSPAAGLAAPLLLAAVLALLLAVQAPWIGHWAWLISTATWGAGLAALVGPSLYRRSARALQGARARHPVAFWSLAMLLLALAIYLPLARTIGYYGDIEIYMAWTHQITHFGIHTAYSPDFVSPPNTTPGLLYPFWVAGQAFRHFFSPDFPPPWRVRINQAYLRFFLRIPALLCTALIAIVVYRLMRRRWGVRVALLAAAAYVFNPAVIFESAYYGQTGAVHSLFMLLGVIGLAEGKPAWGWAALSAGMLTKPQADLFLPLFLVLTWQRYGTRGFLRSVLAALAVGGVMLAPFITHGTLGQMWARDQPCHRLSPHALSHRAQFLVVHQPGPGQGQRPAHAPAPRPPGMADLYLSLDRSWPGGPGLSAGARAHLGGSLGPHALSFGGVPFPGLLYARHPDPREPPHPNVLVAAAGLPCRPSPAVYLRRFCRHRNP